MTADIKRLGLSDIMTILRCVRYLCCDLRNCSTVISIVLTSFAYAFPSMFLVPISPVPSPGQPEVPTIHAPQHSAIGQARIVLFLCKNCAKRWMNRQNKQKIIPTNCYRAVLCLAVGRPLPTDGFVSNKIEKWSRARTPILSSIRMMHACMHARSRPWRSARRRTKWYRHQACGTCDHQEPTWQ